MFPCALRLAAPKVGVAAVCLVQMINRRLSKIRWTLGTVASDLLKMREWVAAKGPHFLLAEPGKLRLSYGSLPGARHRATTSSKKCYVIPIGYAIAWIDPQRLHFATGPP
jgi:hypothetical protein